MIITVYFEPEIRTEIVTDRDTGVYWTFEVKMVDNFLWGLWRVYCENVFQHTSTCIPQILQGRELYKFYREGNEDGGTEELENN